MRAFAAAVNLIKAGVEQVADQFSDFARHTISLLPRPDKTSVLPFLANETGPGDPDIWLSAQRSPAARVRHDAARSSRPFEPIIHAEIPHRPNTTPAASS